MGYMDQAWCTQYPRNCANHECPRARTDKVMEKARKWWGGDDPPFAVMDLSERCGQRIEPTAEPIGPTE